MTTLKEDILEQFSLQSDEPEVENLFFNFEDHATQVKNLILDENLPTPFVIAIHGEWGSGKTTLIKRIKKMVDDEMKDKPNFNTIEFDVWEYERVDVISSLFQIILVEYKTSKKNIERFSESVGYFLSDLALRKTLGITFNEAKAHFNNFISRISTIKSDLEELTKDGRLIIFVDDLDRCHIDNVLDLLEAVKMFFTAKGVIFVVAVDLEKVERAWKLRYKVEEGQIEGREHVEKIFQLKLGLPIKDIFIDQFVDFLIPSLSSDEKNLIGLGCKQNPRKIKRVINLIFFILKNLKDDKNFDKKVSPTIIWCILTSYYPELAKFIKTDSNVFPQLCYVSAYMSIDELKMNLQKMKSTKQKGVEPNFVEGVVEPTDLSITTYEALELIKNKYPDAYSMFQAFGKKFLSSYKDDKVSDTNKLLDMRDEYDSIIDEIMSESGMTGI